MKKLCYIITLVVVFMVLCANVSLAKSDDVLRNGGCYRIALHNGTESFTNNFSKDNAGTLFTVKYWAPIDSQMWILLDAGGGTYEIINKHSGKNLEVPRASLEKNTTLHQYGYTGGSNQKWRFIPTDDGAYYIQNVNSELYLTLQNRLIAQCEKTDENKQRQLFDVNYLIDDKDTAIKKVVIKVADTKNALEPLSEDVSPIMAKPYEEGNNLQVWTLRNIGGDAFKVINSALGLYADVSDVSLDAGGGIIVYQSTGGDNQTYIIREQADGTYKMFAYHSNLTVTVKDDGTVVQDVDGADGIQNFEFIKQD